MARTPDTAVSDTPEADGAGATPRRGRKLSEDRSEAILATVLDLITEVGYDQIRMQDVADRAGVGLSTIYRRWPTKADVVCSALCEKPDDSFPRTGDPRADIRTALAEMAKGLSDGGDEVLLGFLGAARSDPAVGTAFREFVLQRMHEHLRGCLAEALGDDDPDLDLRATIGPALLVYTAAICDQPIETDATAERLTDLMLSPGIGRG